MERAPFAWAAAEDVAAHLFVPELSDVCVIDGSDGHHLQRVRRLRVGEAVTAADESGQWRRYSVNATAPGTLTLAAAGPVRTEPVLEPRLAVAIPILKKGLDEIVAALTELGVARIEPITTERTVVQWDVARAESGVARLRVVAREAAMQSRRARIPEISALAPLSALFARPDVVVADRTGSGADEVPRPDSGWWTMVCGPEGGLTSAEDCQFVGAARLALGPHVLRAITAPVAAAVALLARTE